MIVSIWTTAMPGIAFKDHSKAATGPEFRVIGLSQFIQISPLFCELCWLLVDFQIQFKVLVNILFFISLSLSSQQIAIVFVRPVSNVFPSSDKVYLAMWP